MQTDIIFIPFVTPYVNVTAARAVLEQPLLHGADYSSLALATYSYHRLLASAILLLRL
jgi:hypothetical protein